jgi:hypothetical protein
LKSFLLKESNFQSKSLKLCKTFFGWDPLFYNQFRVKFGVYGEGYKQPLIEGKSSRWHIRPLPSVIHFFLLLIYRIKYYRIISISLKFIIHLQ